MTVPRAGRKCPMRVTEELRALAVVVNRLVEKFPKVPEEQIEDVIQQERRSLDSGRARDFVPLLVEHSARDRLVQFPRRRKSSTMEN